MTDYFLTWFRLDGQDGYLIGTSDDDGQDRIVKDDAGKLAVFLQPDRAAGYAESRGWPLDAAPEDLHDLDAIRGWLAKPRPETVRCAGFLDAWNLFSDASLSVSGEMFETRSEVNDFIYDKLFWGCNLPAAAPRGENYTPAWEREEIDDLRQTLEAGLALFSANISAAH